MRSCERPLKRSARDAVPSSVSKRYSLSTRTHGSFCRHCASSSLRRVSAFSALSSSSRAASHSSRVPILWSVIVSLLSAAEKALLFCNHDLLTCSVQRYPDIIYKKCLDKKRTVRQVFRQIQILYGTGDKIALWSLGSVRNVT